MRIAVTGANGFVGSTLCSLLEATGHDVVALGRYRHGHGPGDILLLDDVSGLTNCFNGADAVIHLAARAHVIEDRAEDRLLEFRRINVEGTRNVAAAAVLAGVGRFVFASSIGVLGNTTGAGAFSETSLPAPVEPYAISKWEAEQLLREVEQRTGLELVVVRPVLVYGPRARGNFQRLLQLVAAERPLPLGSVRNKRSFLGVANLAELLLRCVVEPAAAGKVFVAADGDISTPDLLQVLATAMGRRCRVFPFPLLPLSLGAALVGKRAEFLRMTGNLQVDSSFARGVLGWSPRKSLIDGMSEMADWYAGLRRP